MKSHPPLILRVILLTSSEVTSSERPPSPRMRPFSMLRYMFPLTPMWGIKLGSSYTALPAASPSGYRVCKRGGHVLFDALFQPAECHIHTKSLTSGWKPE